jgi:hypothetical protein
VEDWVLDDRELVILEAELTELAVVLVDDATVVEAVVLEEAEVGLSVMEKVEVVIVELVVVAEVVEVFDVKIEVEDRDEDVVSDVVDEEFEPAKAPRIASQFVLYAP